MSWTRVGNLRGPAGKSAYDLWLEEGNTGTVQDFLDSLKGAGGTGEFDDSGARLYGPYDIAPFNQGDALKTGFSVLPYQLSDEDFFHHALSLRAYNGTMEARLALKVDPVALTSGVAGPETGYSEIAAMTVANPGFNYVVQASAPFTLYGPAPGFAASIHFYPDPGEGYDPYLMVVIRKHESAEWAAIAEAGLSGQARLIAPSYELSELRGQRSYEPTFLGGAPSAPKPSATVMFTSAKIPSVAAQPTTRGRMINIAPVLIDYSNLLIGYGDYQDNTGPLKIVSWNTGGVGGPLDHGLTWDTEEIRVFRVLNDGWIWIPNTDPRGGEDGSTDYLATNSPVPGPGPVIAEFRAVTGIDPPGLNRRLVHAMDVAQHSNGNLYVAGDRAFTPQEEIDADAAVPGVGWIGGDSGMPCVWRSDDGGVTYTEAMTTFFPGGPNPYARFYAMGQIGDRLFVPSHEPVDADGTPNPDGEFRGYWQMEPDETWSLKPPLQLSDGTTISGLGMIYSNDRPVPRKLDRSSWGGGVVTTTLRAAIFTFTDRLVCTLASDERLYCYTGLDEGVGNGYIALGVGPNGFAALYGGDGQPIPTDRVPSGGGDMSSWSFAKDVNGALLICNGAGVYRSSRTFDL